jgi:hypothetical protein
MKKAGRPPIFETPEEMWEAFCEYKEETKKRPYLQHDFVGKEGQSAYRERERPLTFRGFEGYLAEQGRCYDLRDYERQESDHHKKFSHILTRIRATCDRDMIEGSGAGVYNASIAVRVLGLVDKQHNEVKIEQPLFND